MYKKVAGSGYAIEEHIYIKSRGFEAFPISNPIVCGIVPHPKVLGAGAVYAYTLHKPLHTKVYSPPRIWVAIISHGAPIRIINST